VKPPLAAAAWREDESDASHVCSLRSEEGFELSGGGTAAQDDGTIEVRFTVRADPSWATREALVWVGRRSTELRADGLGGWAVEGADRADLQGCTDVDLEFTPATNTLPIRRLGLELGQSAEIEAAWVRFPSLEVERSTQRYERVGELKYRYSSGAFSVDLDVDHHGLVVHYPPYWVREPLGPQ
jgi:uncharacterized protein